MSDTLGILKRNKADNRKIIGKIEFYRHDSKIYDTMTLEIEGTELPKGSYIVYPIEEDEFHYCIDRVDKKIVIGSIRDQEFDKNGKDVYILGNGYDYYSGGIKMKGLSKKVKGEWILQIL